MKYKQLTESIRFTRLFDKVKEYQFQYPDKGLGNLRIHWEKIAPGLYKKYGYVDIHKLGSVVTHRGKVFIL